MPFMTNGRRDYKKELRWEKTKAKHRAEDRKARGKNRYAIEKTTGNLPSSKHIDHKKALTSGGSNTRSNLRVVDARTNLRKEARRKQRKY